MNRLDAVPRPQVRHFMVAMCILGLPACSADEPTGGPQAAIGDGATADGTTSDGAAGGDTSGDPSGDTGDDAGDDDTAATGETAGDVLDDDAVATGDTTSDGSAGGAAFDKSCEEDADCTSAHCAWAYDGKRCTRPCDDGCPTGWLCSTAPGSSDAICIDRRLNLCRPCLSADDCGPDEASICVADADGAGSFCASACASADDCGKDYTCATVAGAAGAAGKGCIPTTGKCECSAWASEAGAETICQVKSPAGSCSGTRACADGALTKCAGQMPVAELCDGADNNCDGEIDEDIVPTACQVTNQWGACPGQTTCAAGKQGCAGEQPAEELCDGADNDCDGETDDGFADSDDDKLADCLDDDDDNDGVLDVADNCTVTANGDQLNTDNDPLGDACDDDDDDDGVADLADNCTWTVNGDQLDSDDDGLGDMCDDDDDNDGVVDLADNCTWTANDDQLDSDKDGEGDACDLDDDGDSVPDLADNCTLTSNADQLDHDKDALGDACDGDDDNDSFGDDQDNCPLAANNDQLDTDKDGDGDACDLDDDDDSVPDLGDNCSLISNNEQFDNDKDGKGDVCDDDDDNDGVLDLADNCTLTANADQLDGDKDGEGDVCDGDDDSDGILDEVDNCPNTANTDQIAHDDDGTGDACDDDDDGDEVLDLADNCTLVANAAQEDNDKDELGDACDDDDDNDLDPDETDCLPLDEDAFHGQTEACNGKDDNCDGQTDEGSATGCTDYWKDGDGDGFGDGTKACVCAKSAPWTLDAMTQLDCDDNAKPSHPGGTEVCGGKDENCDGTTDEDGASGCTQYWLDTDGDGYGVGQPTCMCAPKGNHKATVAGDCHDGDGDAFPKQPEWFSSAGKSGNFDYDCNKVEARQFTKDGAGCKNVLGFCGGNSKTGYVGDAPPCGQAGSYITECQTKWPKCVTHAIDLVQACH